MNPYLKRKREQYDAIRSSIEGLQTRAATENRDLTEEELRSVTDQGTTATAIADEIELLTEQETRSAAVAEMAARVAGNGSGGASGDQQGRGSGTAQDRDPGHYRSEADGGRYSFFADIYHAQNGDEDAKTRLQEHHRALATGGAGAGIIAPRWLSDEYAALARQGRPLADTVRRIPLGNDPRPITLPKQTAGTDAIVAEQAAENDPTIETDAFTSSVDTVSPKPTAGTQIVSRQMLDASSPAIDGLIYGDMIAAYNSKVEAKVAAAMVAAAGAAVTTFATEAAFNTDQDAADAIIDTAMAVWGARKLPADLVVMRVPRWGKFKKLRDADGRPLFPSVEGGAMAVNVNGVGTVRAAGMIEGLAAIPTDGLGTTAYPESILVARASDTLLFEGNMMRFRYEEPLGPESIKMGIWAYTAVLVRYSGASVKRVVVTAAS